MWIIYPLLAALVWAIDYIFVEKVVGKISPLSLIVFEMLIAALVFLPFALFSGLKTDLYTIWSDKKILVFLLISTFAFIIGSFLIVTSIQASNATWSGLIEISYPLFIVLFGWILFREHHLTLGIFIGGILIFSGICTIYFFGKKG